MKKKANTLDIIMIFTAVVITVFTSVWFIINVLDTKTEEYIVLIEVEDDVAELVKYDDIISDGEGFSGKIFAIDALETTKVLHLRSNSNAISLKIGQTEAFQSNTVRFNGRVYSIKKAEVITDEK